MAKKKKTRVDLRKNRSKPPRPKGWTRGFHQHGYEEEAPKSQERVKAKGDLSRRRTIITDDAPPGDATAQGAILMPAVDLASCLPGRVLRVQGLYSMVEAEDGRQYRCTMRRLLRTLVTDARNIVAPGDRVWFRPAPSNEGLIERVEPRE